MPALVNAVPILGPGFASGARRAEAHMRQTPW